MAPKKKQAYVEKAEKDDGSRWEVVDRAGQVIYPSAEGSTKAHATRLAEGLVQSATIREIAA